MIGVLWFAVAAAAPSPSASSTRASDLAVSEAWRLGVPVDVDLLPTVFRFAGGDRVRLEAQVDGLQVLGRTAMVALDPGGRLQRSRIEGTWQRQVSAGAPLPDRAATVTAEAVSAQLGTGTLWPSRVEPAWFAGPRGLQAGWAVHTSAAVPAAT